MTPEEIDSINQDRPLNKRMVRDLMVGDRIDLEGDPYADPDSDHPAYECEYAVVCEIIRETQSCTVIHCEGGPSIGFPPEHLIPYGGHDEGYDEP
jgi:hypothetical protein